MDDNKRPDKDFDYNSIKDMSKEPWAWCDRCGGVTYKSAIMDEKYCPPCWNKRQSKTVRIFDNIKGLLKTIYG